MALDRQGWPLGAAARVECANCGRTQYAHTHAPHRDTYAFDRWLGTLGLAWRSMQTRLGFMVWCGPRCEWLWCNANRRRIKPAFAHDTAGLQHQRYLDAKSRASGAYAS